MKSTGTSTLITMGKGEIKLFPDSAFIKVNVENTDDWSGSAVARTSSKIADVKTILEKNSIMPSEIEIAPLIISSDIETERGQLMLSGEKAVETLTVHINRIENVSSVFTLLSSISGIRIEKPEFEHSDLNKHKEEALKKAVKDALAKGKILAEAAEMKINGIENITENGVTTSCDNGMLVIKAEIEVTFALS